MKKLFVYWAFVYICSVLELEDCIKLLLPIVLIAPELTIRKMMPTLKIVLTMNNSYNIMIN